MTNDEQQFYQDREQQARVEGLDVTEELFASLKVLAAGGAPDPAAAIGFIANAIEELERRLPR